MDISKRQGSGYNFWKPFTSKTKDGVTLTVKDDGSYVLSGTATQITSFYVNGLNYDAADYTIALFNSTAISNEGFYVQVEHENGLLKQAFLTTNTIKSGTTGKVNALSIVIPADLTLNNFTFKPMLLKGIYTANTMLRFEQYGTMPSTHYPSEIETVGSNVNLFDKDNVNKLNAVPDVSSIVANSSGKSFYIKVKSDTAYTISRKIVGARFVVGTTANIPKIGETIIDRIVNNSGSSITLTTSKNANYLVVYYLYNSSENEQEILDSIQIVRGSKAKKYKSYIEEINTLDLGTTELCAIKDINGNVVAQDRIVYKDNKWQFEKNAAIHTIDKTLLKQTSTSTNGKYRYQYFQIKNNVATAKDKNPGVCNIFSLARDGQTYNCEKGFTAITGVWNFYDEGETLEEFITKIENVDIVVTYITKEPIYEYCTSAQSEVLDKLYNNFKLQKGVNNIIVESENGVGVNLELEYMQDLQTKLNLLEAMCVSNASQEV